MGFLLELLARFELATSSLPRSERLAPLVARSTLGRILPKSPENATDFKQFCGIVLLELPFERVSNRIPFFYKIISHQLFTKQDVLT